jgi:hypothetical protein
MVVEMTREQWKERLPIIQAWIDGKTVQVSDSNRNWVNVDCTDAAFNGEYYRIKPELKLRPLKPEEVPVGGVIRRKSDGSRMLIINVFQGGVHVGDSTTPVGFDSLLKNFERFAGFGECQPCGVQEEA